MNSASSPPECPRATLHNNVGGGDVAVGGLDHDVVKPGDQSVGAVIIGELAGELAAELSRLDIHGLLQIWLQSGLKLTYFTAIFEKHCF